jgi:NDP-sugar pyrophosphorylase family protein
MTVNHKFKIIRAYFEDVEKDYSLNLVKEDKPLGTAGSLKLLKEEIDNVFIVTNCDIVIHADYSEIVDLHIKSGNDITLVSSMMSHKIPYGVCERLQQLELVFQHGLHVSISIELFFWRSQN